MKKTIHTTAKTYQIVITDDPYEALEAKEKNLPLVIIEDLSQNKKLCNQFPPCECIIQDFSLIEDKIFLKKMCQRHYNEPWTIVDTSRLVLREMSKSDISSDDFLSDKSPVRTLFSKDYPDNLSCVELQSALFSYIDTMYRLCDFGIWLIIEKKTEKIIGRAGFSILDDLDYPTLSYEILPEYTGRGFAYEASAAALDYGFNELFFERIYCHVKSDNIPSLALAKKLGFSLSPEIREGLAYQSGFLLPSE